MNRRRFLKHAGLWVPATMAFPAIVRAQHVGLDPGIVGMMARPATAAASFTYTSTEFAANGQVNHSGDMTGVTDTDKILFSCWAKFDVVNTAQVLVRYYDGVSGGINFSIVLLDNGRLSLFGRNASNTAVLDVEYNAALSAGTWYHLMCSCDLSTAGKRWWSIGGAPNTYQNTFTAGESLNINGGGGGWYVAGSHAGSLRLDGKLCELYFQTGEYLDLSVESNRNLLQTAEGGHPKSLGSDGSTPTGNQPKIYFKNAYGTFNTNSGGGGTFSFAGTSPTDGGADIP